MSGQIIGGSQAQAKGNNFGVLNSSEVANLIAEDNYSQKAGIEFLGRYDYSSTTHSGINLPNVANGGYIDPSTYRTHLILVSQIRQSGPYNMNNIVVTRNSTLGSGAANYHVTGNETLQDASDNNTIEDANVSSYLKTMNTYLDTTDNSQMVQTIYLFNMGYNTQYVNLYFRNALRSNRYTGRHISYESGGANANRENKGALFWGGYTSSTWNAIYDIYGIRGN